MNTDPQEGIQTYSKDISGPMTSKVDFDAGSRMSILSGL